MRINIASFGGRTHLLDLARELDNNGHEVKFYSFVPSKRAERFGLRRECNKSYFILAVPFLVLLKITKRSFWSLFLFHYCFDHYVAWFSKPCDIFIGQSPMHLYALGYIKKKYGAKIILERGTRHVLEQIKTLNSNPALKGKEAMPKIFIERDLKGYEVTDYISIPSNAVKESFLKHAVPFDKLFVNPYGVNLKEFGPTELDKTPYDLIIVGQWCYRKGCDLLVEVCQKYNYTLLHVGSIIDVKFPRDLNFKHIDSVEQSALRKYYSLGKVFVLPSREEGLALVQPQALMCGLPLVCSIYTGGSDLKKFIDNEEWIIEMKDLSINELNSCILRGLELANKQIGKRSYSVDVSDKLSWSAYGKRYSDFLTSI